MAGNCVLICTYAAGFGHRKSAEAVKEALLKLNPAAEVCIVDPFQLARPRLNALLINFYLIMLKRAPFIYRVLYKQAEKAGKFRNAGNTGTAGTGAAGKARPGFALLWRIILNRSFYDKLSELIDKIDPSAVVCTHPFAAMAVSRWRQHRGTGTPVVTGLITDFTIHPFWVGMDLDGYFVASPELRRQMTARGVPADRVWSVGIPVSGEFARPVKKREARRKLGLYPDKKTVLIMGGGLGLRDLDRVVRSAAASGVNAQLVAVAGVNKLLQEKLERLISKLRIPVQVFGFAGNIPDLMGASDLIVTKPGGITVAEALAAKLPILIWKPIPGQEERNTEYLVSRGLAFYANGEKELAGAVRQRLETRSASRLEMAVLHRLAARNIAGIVKKTYMG